MATAKTRSEPKVKGAAKVAPRGRVGQIKSDYDLRAILGFDSQNPDQAVQKFGLKYFETELEMKDAMYRDCIALRKGAVAGRKWDMQPASEDPRDVAIAEEITWNLLNMKGTFTQAVMNILSALSDGYSLTEIVVRDLVDGPYAGHVGLESLDHKPPEMFDFDTDEFGQVTENGLLLRPGEQGQPRPVSRDRFIHFTFDAKHGNPWGRGLASTCVWYGWFKKEGAKFFLVSLEKWASPTPMAKVPAGIQPGSKDLEHIEKVLKTIQQTTGFWYPEGFEVTLLEATRRGEAGYGYLLEWCDEQMAKCILGQPGTTESGGESSYAAKRSDLIVQDRITDADVESVADALNEQLIRRLVDYNYIVEDYPTIIFPKPRSYASLDAQSLHLLVADGLPVDVKWAYEHFGIDTPEEGAKVLVAAPTAPAMPGFTDRKPATLKMAEGDRKQEIIAFTERAGRELDRYLTAAITEINPLVREATAKWLETVKDSGVFTDRNLEQLKGLVPDFTAAQDPLNRLLYAGALKGLTDAQIILKRDGWKPEAKQFSEGPSAELQFATLIADTYVPPPSEAMAWFAKLQIVTKDVFEKSKLAGRATTLAWTEEQAALRAAQRTLFEAIQNGWTFQEFKDRLLENPTFTSAYYPPAGVNINAHLETVFQTNLMQAYTEGRLQMFNDPDVGDFVEGYEYNAILDDRTRPAHAAMNGRRYRKSSPIWDAWMPPNGYNCRCTIEPVTMLEEGWHEDAQPPQTVKAGKDEVAVQPDEGFGRRGTIET